MNKFFWTILISVLVVTLLIVAYWFVGSGDFLESDLPRSDIKKEMKKIREDEKKIKIVSDMELSGYWFNDEGRLYLVGMKGGIVGVSNRKFDDINFLKESANGERILMGYGYPDNLSFVIFDISKQSWTPLSEGVISADWHPTDSNKLVFLENGRLSLLDLSKEKVERTFGLNMIDAVVRWSDADKIAVSDRPTALVGNGLWELDLDNGSFSKISEGKGVMIKNNDYWRLIFSGSISGRFDSLLLIDRKDPNFKVDVSSLFNDELITLPEKCVLGEFRIYCAFPRDIPNSATLPDDYLRREFVSSDDFYVIIANPQGGVSAELVYSPSLVIDAVNLRKQGDKLYFINRRDGKLYSLELEV